MEECICRRIQHSIRNIRNTKCMSALVRPFGWLYLTFFPWGLRVNMSRWKKKKKKSEFNSYETLIIYVWLKFLNILKTIQILQRIHCDSSKISAFNEFSHNLRTKRPKTECKYIMNQLERVRLPQQHWKGATCVRYHNCHNGILHLTCSGSDVMWSVFSNQ